MTDKGLKFDDGKLDLTLIPWDRVASPRHRDLILPLYLWYRGENPTYEVQEDLRLEYAARGRDLIADAAAAMNYGATKYEPWNWEKGVSRKRLYAAACRHYHAIERGEETDPESGLSHYEHLAFYPMAIFAAIDDGPETLTPVQHTATLVDTLEYDIQEALKVKRKPVELTDAPELRI